MSNARELAELGGSYGTGGFVGMKNRIINGAMVIDQRNAGASFSVATAADVYALDRWCAAGQSADGVFTVQQDTVAPAGFKNSMKVTVTTADSSIGASQYYVMQQMIEGLNCADLGFGTANASTITLSFWVRSSVTGTFGGSLRNASFDRNYPFSYTINSANTWEQKTITIAGDTSGTWSTGITTGIRITWSLGDGSNRLGAAGVWANGNISGVTGQTNLIATNGATWYITGVQLEKGSTATSFDYRPYGTELALCQRYYEKSYEIDVVPSTNTYVGRATAVAVAASSTQLDQSGSINFKVTKRSAPTLQYWRQQGTASVWSISGPAIGLFTTFNPSTNTASQTCFEVASQATSGVSGMTAYAMYAVFGQWAASAEL